MPERTVRYNLARLFEAGAVKEKPNCNDLREKLYFAGGLEE